MKATLDEVRLELLSTTKGLLNCYCYGRGF